MVKMVEYPDISLFVSVYLPNQFVHRDENISPNHPFSQINCPEIKGTVIRIRNIYEKWDYTVYRGATICLL